MAKLINGGVYKNGLQTFVLVFFDPNNWGMLYIHRHSIEVMSCPMFQHDENGSFCFTEEELKEKFNSDKWRMLDGRLRIEKIDPQFRLVEYPIVKNGSGSLEEFNPSP